MFPLSLVCLESLAYLVAAVTYLTAPARRGSRTVWPEGFEVHASSVRRVLVRRAALEPRPDGCDETGDAPPEPRWSRPRPGIAVRIMHAPDPVLLRHARIVRGPRPVALPSLTLGQLRPDVQPERGVCGAGGKSRCRDR